MTQPNTLNMTFDTSLVDLNPSFSTTESDPISETDLSAQPTIKTPEMHPLEPNSQEETPKPSQNQSIPTSSTPVQHLPTQTTYDQWSAVYDTDGNMLQAIDSLELATLLPAFLDRVLASHQSTPSDPSFPNAPHILELGCGTGRNTQSLISHTWPPTTTIYITALDFSAGMLAQAQQKLTPLTTSHPNIALHLAQTDCFPSASDPAASPKPTWSAPPSSSPLPPVSALLSTLVLEHIPLSPFFATLASLLSPGGHALVTNMHSEMGRVSQAGFVNAAGVKVRGTSWAHTLEETVDEAQRAGFEVLGRWERAVKREDLEAGVVGARGEKWVGVRVWYAVWVRRV